MIKRHFIYLIIVAVVAIIGVCSIGRLVEEVKNEEITVNQRAFTGKMEYWTTPGLKWQGFGRTTTYYKTNQFWFGASANANEKSIGSPIPVIFNDASEGFIYGSLRVKLPLDPKYIERIQTDYAGMDRLMNDLVSQTVNKVVYASGPLMSAFESYAEKKNDLIYYITDQLNNGVYKTKVNRVETVDPLTGEKKVINVASLIESEDAPGGYARSESSPFAYYGLEIGQVSVSRIDYSEQVKKQIAQQQEANMRVQTAKAQSIAAQEDARRIVEMGKAEAEKSRWEQEKIKAVEVTKAQQEFEVARLAALKAQEEAKRIKAEGEAKAAANLALVRAGLTPLEKANIEKETAIGVAQALSNSKVQWVPQIMINGKDAQGNGTAMDAVGLKMLLDLVEKQK